MTKLSKIIQFRICTNFLGKEIPILYIKFFNATKFLKIKYCFLNVYRKKKKKFLNDLKITLTKQILKFIGKNKKIHFCCDWNYTQLNELFQKCISITEDLIELQKDKNQTCQFHFPGFDSRKIRFIAP